MLLLYIQGTCNVTESGLPSQIGRCSGADIKDSKSPLHIFTSSPPPPPPISRYVLNESQTRQSLPLGQGSSAAAAAASGPGGSGIPQPPPGMSFYAAKRVIGDNPWTPEQLEQVKPNSLLCRRVT